MRYDYIYIYIYMSLGAKGLSAENPTFVPYRRNGRLYRSCGGWMMLMVRNDKLGLTFSNLRLKDPSNETEFYENEFRTVQLLELCFGPNFVLQKCRVS